MVGAVDTRHYPPLGAAHSYKVMEGIVIPKLETELVRHADGCDGSRSGNCPDKTAMLADGQISAAWDAGLRRYRRAFSGV